MSRTRGIPRLIVSMTTTLVVATASVVAIGTPAQAVDVPAYGVITITDDGTGFVPAWTYDPALWSCSTEVEGQFNAPTAVIVTCRASEGMSFICPRMVLTTHTAGFVARAGGRATCTYDSLDTGIISGFNAAQRTGDLGRALWVKCAAYSDIPLIPPYTVTCNEPGLPTL
ncbi:MAG TPA: hypothetical protein VNQ77_01560 [Frankiaceae bacterium]|nr:hypothetical protein [Frankiaceae bacterium]